MRISRSMLAIILTRGAATRARGDVGEAAVIDAVHEASVAISAVYGPRARLRSARLREASPIERMIESWGF